VALVAFLLCLRKRTQARAGCGWLSWMPAGTILAELALLAAQPHDVSYMFKVTIDRLLIHVWPSIILLIGTRSFVQPPGEAIAS
jgi:hypothetical protein